MKVFAATAAVLAASASASAAPSRSWKSLHRPLHVPRIGPGVACPVTTQTIDFGRWGIGVGFGRGPAAPVGMNENGRPVLRYQDPISPESLFYGSAWFGNKVLWAVTPSYTGPVLTGGRQLNGPNPVRFEEGGRKRLTALDVRPPCSIPPQTRGKPLDFP